MQSNILLFIFLINNLIAVSQHKIIFTGCPLGNEVPTVTEQFKEDALFDEINRVRKDTFGIVTPLIRNPKLDNVARYHVQDMEADGYFCHYTYDVGGSDICAPSSTSNLQFKCDQFERIANFLGVASQSDEALSGNVSVDAVVSTGGSGGYAFSWLGHASHRTIVSSDWAVTAGVGVCFSSKYGYNWALELSAAPLSINDSKSFNRSVINVFPNPFHQQAEINIKYIPASNFTSGKFKLEIYDLFGRSIRHESVEYNWNNITIQRGELNSGVYFFNIIDAQKNIAGHGKFVITD